MFKKLNMVLCAITSLSLSVAYADNSYSQLNFSLISSVPLQVYSFFAPEAIQAGATMESQPYCSNLSCGFKMDFPQTSQKLNPNQYDYPITLVVGSSDTRFFPDKSLACVAKFHYNSQFNFVYGSELKCSMRSFKGYTLSTDSANHLNMEIWQTPSGGGGGPT